MFTFLKIFMVGWCVMYVDLILSFLGCYLEKTMALHSCILAWKIPWTDEPGRLQSIGSLRVGHDWATSLSLFTFMRWRRKWQLTPIFLPGESQGRGSLVGCHLWGCTELDTSEWLSSSSRVLFIYFYPWRVLDIWSSYIALVWRYFSM